MIDERWLFASLAVLAGLVVGAVGGAWLRRWLQRETNRIGVREIAGPASLILFWFATATGIVVAMASSSPETLRPLPRQVLNWLPNVVAAGLIILGGYAVAAATSRSVARAFERITGNRNRLAERSLRTVILTGSAILALGQLGVETTILIVLTSGVVFSIGLTAALLAGHGGRIVARSIAAGRVLGVDLKVGQKIQLGNEQLLIAELRPATAVLESASSERILISYTALFETPIRILPNARNQEATATGDTLT